MKGNTAKKPGSFARYTGNLKSEGGSLPKGNTVKKAGGKVKSNLKKTGVAKKLKSGRGS